ncbi:MAG: LytTR family DNA-binding domain-containing protein [Acidobacteriota bacterium]
MTGSPTNRPLRVLIVDDEELARAALRSLLDRESGVEVVGEANGGESGLVAVRDLSPDLLLLDIQMPRMDGFELVQRLDAPPPLVVFVTAYDDYAIAAFRALALDYLLKPCSAEALRAALDRARRQLEADDLADLGRRLQRLAASTPQLPTDPPPVDAASRSSDGAVRLERIAARKRDRTVVIDVSDVEWIEADDYCVRVHASGAVHVLRRSLKWFGERLDPRRFVRVHRSALVNLAHLREIQHRGADDHVAILTSGAEVPLSRRGRDAMDRALESG